MPRPYKLEVVERSTLTIGGPAVPGHNRKQRFHGRIKAGNGAIVFTTETMHNEADVEAAFTKLVAAIQAGNFLLT